jgi:copper chaperone CopZ
MKSLATTALAICLLVIIGCAEGTAPAPETTATIAEATNKVEANISGMDCSGCSSSVTTAVNGVEGVTACAVDLKTGDVSVALADDADVEAAKANIEAAIASLSDGKFTVNTIAVSTADDAADDAETPAEAQEDAPTETGSGY